MSVDTGDDFSSQDIVNDLSDDSGQGDSVQPDVSSDTPSSDNAPTGDNPAWKPYLDKFDPSQHAQVKEILSDIDSNVNRRFERVSQLEKNYGQFAQNNVDPRMLQAGYQLFQNLNTNPQAFYQKLGESLGISPQEAEDLVEDDVDPNYAAMRDQVAQMGQYLQQQQELQRQQAFQREVQEEGQKIEADLNQVREKYNLSDTDVQGVIRRTISLSQENPNSTIFDGLQLYLNERTSWERSRPTNNAPSVISGNGSAVAPPNKNFTELDSREQKQDIIAALRGLS